MNRDGYATLIGHSTEQNSKTESVFVLDKNVRIHMFNLYSLMTYQINALLLNTFYLDFIDFLTEKENIDNNLVRPRKIEEFAEKIANKTIDYILYKQNTSPSFSNINSMDFVMNNTSNIIPMTDVDYQNTQINEQQEIIANNNFKLLLIDQNIDITTTDGQDRLKTHIKRQIKTTMEYHYILPSGEIIHDYIISNMPQSRNYTPRGLILFDKSPKFYYKPIQLINNALTGNVNDNVYLSQVVDYITKSLELSGKRVDLFMMACRGIGLTEYAIPRKIQTEKIFALSPIVNQAYVFNEFNTYTAIKFFKNKEYKLCDEISKVDVSNNSYQLLQRVQKIITVEEDVEEDMGTTETDNEQVDRSILLTIPNIYYHTNHHLPETFKNIQNKQLNQQQISQIIQHRLQEFHYETTPDQMLHTRNTIIFYISDKSDNIYASMQISIDDKKNIMITDVVTNPSQQGRNYGSILLFYSLREIVLMSDKSFNEIYLFVIFDRPDLTFKRMKLYNSLGFFIYKPVTKEPVMLSDFVLDTYNYKLNIPKRTETTIEEYKLQLSAYNTSQENMMILFSHQHYYNSKLLNVQGNYKVNGVPGQYKNTYNSVILDHNNKITYTMKLDKTYFNILLEQFRENNKNILHPFYYEMYDPTTRNKQEVQDIIIKDDVDIAFLKETKTSDAKTITYVVEVNMNRILDTGNQEGYYYNGTKNDYKQLGVSAIRLEKTNYKIREKSICPVSIGGYKRTNPRKIKKTRKIRRDKTTMRKKTRKYGNRKNKGKGKK